MISRKSKQPMVEILMKENGMSLIEIMVAITLIAIMGTFVTGKVFNFLYEGQVRSTRIQMNNFKGLLKEFRRKCGFYPSAEQGLEALIEKPATGKECRNYPTDGFLDGEDIPLDPWENEYLYTSNGKKFNIISYSQDGEEGGEEKDADIHLNKKKK